MRDQSSFQIKMLFIILKKMTNVFRSVTPNKCFDQKILLFCIEQTDHWCVHLIIENGHFVSD